MYRFIANTNQLAENSFPFIHGDTGFNVEIPAELSHPPCVHVVTKKSVWIAFWSFSARDVLIASKID